MRPERGRASRSPHGAVLAGVVGLLALAYAAMPAWAGGTSGTATLREALRAVPVGVVADRGGIVASFIDVQNTIAASGGDVDAAFRFARRGTLIRTLNDMRNLPFDASRLDAWSRSAGADIRGFRYLAGYGVAPTTVDLWGLGRPEDGRAVAARLSDLGFSAVAGATEGWTMLANGEDNHIDLAKRNPDDPWVGPLGRTSVVAIRDGLLLHAASRGAVRGAMAAASAPMGTRALADLPAIDTALAGLDAGLGGLPLVTVLVSPGPEGEPDRLGPPLTAAAHWSKPLPFKIEAPLPLVMLSAIAVRSDGPGNGTSASIQVSAYPDCAAAGRAADLLAAVAASKRADLSARGARVDTRTVDDGAKGCAVAIVVMQTGGPARPR